MLNRSNMLFLSVASRRIGAALLSPGKPGPTLTDAFVADYPDGLDPADPRQLGAFLTEALADRGFGAAPVVLCLERKDVVSKRLTFEHVDDLEAELPGMVRLQMLRQLNFPAENAAIDFALLPGASGADAGSGDEVTVRAVAAPGERLEHLREALTLAKLKPTRAALSAEGVAHLLVGADAVSPTNAELVVVPALDGVELLIVRDGRVANARWHALPPSADTADPVSFYDLSIAAEARRTWMSDQLAESSARINRVVVLVSPGDEGPAADAAASLAEHIAEDLSINAVTLDPATLVGVREAFDCRLTHLLGVASEHFASDAGPARIDLLNPRRAPDRAAPIRQMAMLAVLALLAVLGGIWTFANMRTAELETRLEQADERRQQAWATRAEAVREAARVEHIRRHLAGSASPLATLDAFAASMPERERAIITGFSYAVATETAFDAPRGARQYDGEHWVTIRTIAADLGVKAATREDADALRDAFVSRPELYVDTAGADGATTNDPAYPHRLVLELVRRERDPAGDLDRYLPAPRPEAGRDAADEMEDGRTLDADASAVTDQPLDRESDATAAADADESSDSARAAADDPSPASDEPSPSADESTPADADPTDVAEEDGGER